MLFVLLLSASGVAFSDSANRERLSYVYIYVLDMFLTI